MSRFVIVCLLLASAALQATGQVYTPKVLKKGQPDATDLSALAKGIYVGAHATTDREQAEAIWRFFLTDGRFVKPGMIYHIAGWAYEEPWGEVLDPVRLLNSYGFGLCYHIAPLLESVFKAGGFPDARVWFLTGHTVAEVFYGGAYHYFDSDMMGYNPIGTTGPLNQRTVASVHQIEQDATIITGKLAGPKQVDVANADSPWYPADVRAHAIDGLADLFTTAKDNWVYPFQRYQNGHTMDFVLRPGERITRYFHPNPASLSYLPYRFDGTSWREFPQELSEYKIRTEDGPQSQKDQRRWATGTQEYRPAVSAAATAVYSMPCPYVIIDASFQMNVVLRRPSDQVSVETSIDGGQNWIHAATLNGRHQGLWTARPAVLTESEHGSRNAVSGTYGYLLRITQQGAQVSGLTLATRFQLNPRTLPQLEAGNNELEYTSAGMSRWELPVPAPAKTDNISAQSSEGQTYLINSGDFPGELVFAVEAPDGGEIDGFDVGGRFLDLRDGLAPDKFTAEVRKVAPWPGAGARQAASLSWASSMDGIGKNLWTYEPLLKWKDNDAIDRTLRWPEVDRQVRNLPKGTRRVYVRYRLHGMALDSIRIAAVRSGLRSGSALTVTHIWLQDGIKRQQVRRIGSGQPGSAYKIQLPAHAVVSNEALIFEAAALSR